MMLRPLAITLCALALAGCEQVARTTDVVAENTVGSPARLVLEPALTARYGSAAEGQRATQCVVSHATPGELAVIAADATSIEGPAPDVSDLIDRILQRPETANCLAGAAG